MGTQPCPPQQRRSHSSSTGCAFWTHLVQIPRVPLPHTPCLPWTSPTWSWRRVPSCTVGLEVLTFCGGLRLCSWRHWPDVFSAGNVFGLSLGLAVRRRPGLARASLQPGQDSALGGRSPAGHPHTRLRHGLFLGALGLSFLICNRSTTMPSRESLLHSAL